MEKTELDILANKILELKDVGGVLFFDKDGNIIAWKPKDEVPIVPKAVVEKTVIIKAEMLHELAYDLVKYVGPLDLMVLSYKHRNVFIMPLKKETYVIFSTRKALNLDIIEKVRKILAL